MRQVRTHIHHAAWYGAGEHYSYSYRMEHAPWVRQRLAHDVEAPPHLLDFLAAELAQYEPIEVTDGTTTHILRPRIETWEMQQLDTGPVNYSVRVAWFRDGERVGYFGKHYDVNHTPEFLAAHDAHRAAIAAAIPPSLEDKGGMPHDIHRKAGPIPHGHPLKHPDSQPESL